MLRISLKHERSYVVLQIWVEKKFNRIFPFPFPLQFFFFFVFFLQKIATINISKEFLHHHFYVCCNG